MSEFDELAASPRVLMAGRFGAAVTTMFGSMAFAVDTLTQSGFSQDSWLLVRNLSQLLRGGQVITGSG